MWSRNEGSSGDPEIHGSHLFTLVHEKGEVVALPRPTIGACNSPVLDLVPQLDGQFSAGTSVAVVHNIRVVDRDSAFCAVFPCQSDGAQLVDAEELLG